MVLRTILFILLMTKNLQAEASGFDAYSSCYRTSRKRQELPCDFGSQTWCTIPGNSYPWHAVRRFVHENQGLMRRMYGDERHISVLRAELESNDIEFFSPSVKEDFRRRYSKDIDGTKEFVKILINDGRKFVNEPKIEKTTKIEKVRKSIEESSSSNNALYKTNVKKEEEDLKIGLSNSFGQKSEPKHTSTSSTTAETTVGVVTSEGPTNYTTVDPPNATFYAPTDLTTQASNRMESVQSNLTSNLNETEVELEVEEEFDYVSEPGEMATTTNADALTTTEKLEEEEKDNNEYDDVVEEVEAVKQATVEEPVSIQPPPMIRLKGINACPVKEEVVAPFWANNTRGEVLALLNLYPFEQYVHWEKCTYEHKQMFCREGCRCEQQYRLHRLLAYDPNNECRGIFSDWFRFPSCCVCKCYDLPMEFRLTSRSPRIHQSFHVFGKESSNIFKAQP